jgi:hypothetical protein
MNQLTKKEQKQIIIAEIDTKKELNKMMELYIKEMYPNGKPYFGCPKIACGGKKCYYTECSCEWFL